MKKLFLLLTATICSIGGTWAQGGNTKEYTVNGSEGKLYNGNKANQSWNSAWKSNANPDVKFSCGANNMNWVGDTLQMMTGTAGSATYTFSVPGGETIEEYTFTFANNDHETGISLTYKDSVYTTSTTPQTISETGQSISSFSFTLKGTNGKGVVLTDFKVKVKTIEQEVNTYWSVGTGANDKAAITWIGFTVPTVNDEGETVSEVSLRNIHLCTNIDNKNEKTAYMVISSTKNISDKVAVSTNKPAPVHNAFTEYKFKNIKLTAGNTYYMFFSESDNSLVSCGQRVAISDANGGYEPKVGAGGAEKTWLPYFKVNVPDPSKAPLVFSTTYGEKWLRFSNSNISDYTWEASSEAKAGTAQLDMSKESQLFCFVGNNTDGFDIYNKALGQEYKLTAPTEPKSGNTVSWTKETSSKWFLDMSQNSAATKPGIGITTNVQSGLSLNMYGGKGGDLKFYDITDAGSRWGIIRVEANPLDISFSVTGETKYPENNNRIGEFRLSYGGTTSVTTVTKELNGVAKKMYLPFGQNVSMSTFTYHGWNSVVDNDSIVYSAEEYSINSSEGKLYKDGKEANQSWNSAWKSDANSDVKLSCEANNMNWAGESVQMMTGQRGSATYTFTVPEGAIIEEYAFTFANNGHETGISLTYKDSVYTTSTTPQTIGETGQSISSFSFTLKGANGKGVVLTDFKVKVKSVESYGPTSIAYIADTESEYQYLWYHNNPPYRIPAIATRKDGKLLAVCDYRPCGGDIGNGRVDLVQRIGNPDGKTWVASKTIIEGNGSDSWNGNDGFGDPAICIDRETGRVLLMAVTGRVVCTTATRQNPNRMARFYSEDGGETYHSAVAGRDSIYDDITEEFYGLWDTEAYKTGDKTSTDQYTAQSLFIGSGRIFQSSKIKVGEYYRIYAALWSKDMHNRVAYSDDFGMTWHILGTREDMPFPNFGNANEPKCEELPNGDVIMSARKPNGRYYNIFTYSDVEKGQGSWGEGTNSNINAPSDWNGTNGEISTYEVEDVDGNLCKIALQSLPMGLSENQGDVRRNVGFFFKDITKNESYQKEGKNDVAAFASGWEKGMLVSTAQGSGYSTYSLQNDGRLAFFYEETPGGYSMVYVPLTISEITNGKYVRIITEQQKDTVVAVSGIKLDKDSVVVSEGDTITLVATITPEDATDKTVVWSSSDSAVAVVDNGVVIAVSPGVATITAKSGDHSATCVVTVEKKVVPVSSIALDKTEATVVEGDTITLVATITPEDATDKTVEWSSSDSAVAVVDNGVVIAVSPGVATITAKSGEYSATCVVTVEASESTGINSVNGNGRKESIYDLFGRPAKKMSKGKVYIVNGKKTIKR